jgi:hypothetical protein
MLDFLKKKWYSGDTDTDAYSEQDNFIEYNGFVRKLGEKGAGKTVLRIYDNGLMAVRRFLDIDVYYLVDADTPKGRYLCEGGAYEFIPSEEIDI